MSAALATQPAVALRRALHRHPELSGREADTARRIVEYFDALRPGRTVTGLGGHGLAFEFAGTARGPTVLLRCELDALPIPERNGFDHRSRHDGVAHKCGHDGHMAILAEVGRALSERRPPGGRVVLLYQPAEETGAGAAAVIDDPKFAALRPDVSFALHNVPGFPSGRVVCRAGTMACASRGMQIELCGREAHAAQPETGASPAAAMTSIIAALTSEKDPIGACDELAFATVVGARLGAKAFGTAPARAEVWATLRSETDETMQKLVGYAERCAQRAAGRDGLDCAIGYEDVFPATRNTPGAIAALEKVCAARSTTWLDQPFRWSEDFGHFTALGEGALFGLGAGESTPDLHDPDYDFPDALIETGAGIFLDLVDEYLT